MLDNGHISVKLEKVQIHGIYMCERTLILIIDEVTRNGVWFSKSRIQGAFSPFSIEVPIKWYFRPNINLLTQMHLKNNNNKDFNARGRNITIQVPKCTLHQTFEVMTSIVDNQ